MQAVQGGLLGGHKSTPVEHKNMLFPPACSSPLITEDRPGSWPGQYMGRTSSNNTVPKSIQDQYHKLPAPIVLKTTTSQARLHGVLGRKFMHISQWLSWQAPARTAMVVEFLNKHSAIDLKLSWASVYGSYCSYIDQMGQLECFYLSQPIHERKLSSDR